MKRDNIHYTFRAINGYPQPFKFVISPREPGKTTAAVWEIMHKNYIKGGITILLMRNNVDITEGYIYSIQENNNKFDDAPKLKLSWKADELKGGIVHIYNEDSSSGEKRLFAVCVSLSTKNSIRKRLQYPNAKAMIMDEFICDLSVGEKYLKGEYARFLETYNTFNREYRNKNGEKASMPVYFLGNPYSLYNPYFVGLKVNTRLLHPGAIISGPNYVIQCYQLTEELKQLILKSNPLYQFDDSYTRYAFNGMAVQDEKIPLCETLPKNYSLKFIFKIENKYIECYRGDTFDTVLFWWIRLCDNSSSNKIAYCFDYEELVARCALISLQDRKLFTNLKTAIKYRRIDFNCIECYYLFKEIYLNI